MASAAYPLGLQALLTGGVDLDTDDIRVILVDTADYTYSSSHNALDDVPSGARVATAALGSEAVTNGTFDAANTTLSAVTGDPAEALIIYKHTGTESTSTLLFYIDGISVTPNGGDITINWNASGIAVFG